jgi:hypothetical protein
VSTETSLGSPLNGELKRIFLSTFSGSSNGTEICLEGSRLLRCGE